MNIPDFPECQLPAPSVSDEPDAKHASIKSNTLHSRSSRLEDENPCTPAQTSTTTATKAEEEQSPQREGMILVDDDGVPMNRSDSFRNLSTLIAWERIEGIHSQQSDSSLTRQKPQPTLDLSKFNKGDELNEQYPFSEAAKITEIQSELDREEDYVLVEEGGKSEKIPFRTRVMWKLRNLRIRKKAKPPRCKNESS